MWSASIAATATVTLGTKDELLVGWMQVVEDVSFVAGSAPVDQLR